MNNELRWKKFYPLSDKNAFICLVEHMGDDSSIVQAARVSYDGDAPVGRAISDKTKKKVLKDNEFETVLQKVKALLALPSISWDQDNMFVIYYNENEFVKIKQGQTEYELVLALYEQQLIEDRQLIRYLMNHSHTTPFEMVEIKFMIQVPMDCWRQWIRHRTANVNEYSTRYTEAIDAMQVTLPGEWRLQATDNKQGSSGFLANDEPDAEPGTPEYDSWFTNHKGGRDEMGFPITGDYLTAREKKLHSIAKEIYNERLKAGIAKEQARKDLPLSTYTRAYWKCDLHNIFNFLRLRMDSHAQLEIRSFANSMFEIVKQICPVACEAFEDYVLHAKRFSRMEMEVLRNCLGVYDSKLGRIIHNENTAEQFDKPSSMTDREWKEFLSKLS